MSTAHTPNVPRHHPTNRAREVAAAILAVPATILAAYTGWAIVDLATTTYVGGEVLTVQIIIVAAGLLTTLAWAGVLALHTSARRDLRPAPRHLLVNSMAVALVCSVVALLGLPGWMSIAAFGLAALGGVTALVAAARL